MIYALPSIMNYYAKFEQNLLDRNVSKNSTKNFIQPRFQTGNKINEEK